MVTAIQTEGPPKGPSASRTVIRGPRLCACGCGEYTKPKQSYIPKKGTDHLEHHEYCMNHSKRKDVEQEFWKNVLIIEDEDSCWEWQGTYWSDGRYGRAYAGIMLPHDLAHRMAYRLQVGDIPEGIFVCHTCDNTRCVRGSHLFLGTTKDNAEDMVNKGRSLRGVRNRENQFGVGRGRKLTVKQVEEIKWYLRKGFSQKNLARNYNVSNSLINLIANNKAWVDVQLAER